MIESEPEPAWLAELETRRLAQLRMGGEEAIARQHDMGKQTARERLDDLLDRRSFVELGRLTGKGEYDERGRLTGFQPANAIVGTGRIGRQKVCVSADDYTIRAGSSEATNAEKWIYAERMALAYRMPLVRLVDSAGGSVRLLQTMQATKIPEYTNWPSMELLQTVPVVGVAMGACAGLGALKVLSSHFSIMVRDTSQVFAAGPPVVKQAYGIEIEKNELGGYQVHRKNGLVQNEAVDEKDALDQVRRFLSYLPGNIYRVPPVTDSEDDPGRVEDWLKNAIPENSRKTYKPRKILEAVFDQSSLFEIGRYYGGSVITCLARLNGYPVGVIANNPAVGGGAMNSAAALKMERFTGLCSRFHLPVVNFVDQPGNATGPDAELEGTLMGAVRVGEALADCRSPWVSIILRRCFGLAGALHGPKENGALNHRFAWPTARWGSIPIEGGVMAAHKAEISEADDPERKRLEIEEFYHNLASPYRTAERFGILDVIDPRETRGLLCDWIEDVWEVIETDTRVCSLHSGRRG